jgi:hypothetical protein
VGHFVTFAFACHFGKTPTRTCWRLQAAIAQQTNWSIVIADEAVRFLGTTCHVAD